LPALLQQTRLPWVVRRFWRRGRISSSPSPWYFSWPPVLTTRSWAGKPFCRSSSLAMRARLLFLRMVFAKWRFVDIFPLQQLRTLRLAGCFPALGQRRLPLRVSLLPQLKVCVCQKHVSLEDRREHPAAPCARIGRGFRALSAGNQTFQQCCLL
jgi:hypothetical protein